MAIVYNTLYQSTGQIIISEKQFKRGNYNKIEKVLSKDRYVVMYPEGRTHSEGLGIFQKGTAQIAYSLAVPLVPLRLEGVSEVWPRGGKLQPTGSMRIKIGRPINPRNPAYNNGSTQPAEKLKEKIKIARTLTEVVRNEIERLGISG